MKNKINKVTLISASGNGDLEEVKRLLSQGANINIQDITGNTPLIAASKNNHVSVVRALLAANANTESQNITGSTALARASRNGHVEVVAILNDSADVNAQNKKGYTSLMWASIMGHDEVIDELLKAGPDADIKNENGDTALIMASRAGHIEIIKKLVGFGADANIRNQKGNMAVDEAYSGEVQQMFGREEQANLSHNNAKEQSDYYKKFKIAASVAAVGLVTIFQLKNQETRRDLASHIELNIKCISHLKKKINDKTYRVPAGDCEEAMGEILYENGHWQDDGKNGKQ